MEPQFPADIEVTGARLIGEGGSGIVYAASHARFGAVAVKIARDTSGEIRQLFVSEYRLLRSLDHRGILPALDLRTLPDQRSALVTPLCQGGDLYRFAQNLSPRERFRPLGQVLAALEYLHSLGLIHRDLKGDNILMHESRGAQLADLGLAAARSTDDRKRGGTLAYMAPEVIDNRGATVESDIYSLGVILYFLACGRLPFAATDPMQVISQKQQPDHIDFDRVAAAISPRLARLIRSCLSPEPDQRPKQIRDVADSLTLDQLIDRTNFETRSLKSYWHHHLYSYNAGFWQQEARNLAAKPNIIHYVQAEAVGLQQALVDHLRVSGINVDAADADTLHYNNGHGQTTVHWHAAPADSSLEGVTEYAEVDSFAFSALLDKLFPREVDPVTRNWLLELSSGNLGLLWEILNSLERARKIDVRTGRLAIDAVSRFQYELPPSFISYARQLTPNLTDGALELAQLLAADPGMYSATALIEMGVAAQTSVAALQARQLLDSDATTFRRGYYRLVLNSATDATTRRRLHSQWLKIIEETDGLSKTQRARMTFHHAGHLENSELAFDAAIDLARELILAQDVAAAADILDQALSFPDAAGRRTRFVVLLSLRADVSKTVGDLDNALRGFARVVRFGTRLQEQELVAQAYKKLGDVYKGKRDYRRGSRALDRAVKIFGRAGNELELSHCFNNIGNICWIAGDLEGAEVNYETALEVQRNLGAEKAVASTLNNLASTNWRRGQYDRAIVQFKESLEIKRRLNDEPEMARTFNNLSVAYFEQDELSTAQEYLQQALEINQKLGNRGEVLYNYSNFFEIEFRRGDFNEARRWVLKGLRETGRAETSVRGEYATYLAQWFLVTGHYQKAKSILELAERLGTTVTNAELDAFISGTRADLFRLVGAHEPGLLQIESAIEKIAAVGDKKRQCSWMIRRCALLRATGHSATSIEQEFAAASALLDSLPAKRERLELLLERAEFSLANDNQSAAAGFLDAVLATPDFGGSATFRPRISLLRGQLELDRGNSGKAVQLLSEAALAAQKLGTPEMHWTALAWLGHAYREVRDYERSLKSYIEAFEIVKSLALQITDKKLRKFYLADRRKKELAERLEEMSTLVA